MTFFDFFKRHIRWVMTISLAIVVLCLYTLYQLNLQAQQYEALQAQYLGISDQLTQLQSENETLSSEKQKLIDEIAKTIVSYDAQISELNGTIASLENQISDPFVLDYIKQHGYNSAEELLQTMDVPVPIDGVLGGTMRWYDSKLLTQNWALGYFEDGHIGGYAILSYAFDGAGNVTWEIVAVDLL
jgi:hypothetical protein